MNKYMNRCWRWLCSWLCLSFPRAATIPRTPSYGSGDGVGMDQGWIGNGAGIDQGYQGWIGDGSRVDHSGPVPPSPRGLRRTGSAALALVEPSPISEGRAGSRAPIGYRGALLFSAAARAVRAHSRPPGGAVGGAGPARGAVLPPGGRIATERNTPRGQRDIEGTEGHWGNRGTPRGERDMAGTEGCGAG